MKMKKMVIDKYNSLVYNENRLERANFLKMEMLNNNLDARNYI